MSLKLENILAKLTLPVRLVNIFSILFITLSMIVFLDAAKKYHEYLVRQQKPVTQAQKQLLAKSSRILQRRQRVCIPVLMTEVEYAGAIILCFPCSCMKDTQNMQLGEK